MWNRASLGVSRLVHWLGTARRLICRPVAGAGPFARIAVRLGTAAKSGGRLTYGRMMYFPSMLAVVPKLMPELSELSKVFVTVKESLETVAPEAMKIPPP